MFQYILLYSIEAVYPVKQCHRVLFERTQKFAARCITKKWSHNISASELCTQLNWKPIYHHVFVRRLCIIYAYTHFTRFTHPSVFRFKNQSIRARDRTNHSKALLLPIYKLSRPNASAIIVSCHAYNMLSNDIIRLPPSAFKHAINNPEFLSTIVSSQLTTSKNAIVSIINI